MTEAQTAADVSAHPLMQHARVELSRCGLSESADPVDREIAEGMLHSMATVLTELGDKAPLSYAIAFLPVLLSGQPIGLLTGEDDEWEDMTEHNEGIPLFQNKRCSTVFKNGDGAAFDVTGLMYRYPDGVCAHRSGKVRMIQFPYDASNDPIVIDVDHKGEPRFDFDFQRMPDFEATSFCGADAVKWAHFFCQTVSGQDVGTMTAWFANAIETASDRRHWDRLCADEALSTTELKSLQNLYSMSRARDLAGREPTVEEKRKDDRVMAWLDNRHMERKLAEMILPEPSETVQ